MYQHTVNPHSEAILNGGAPQETTALVLPEDKVLITDFLECVMQQMQPCKLTAECGRHTDRPIGFPGLACKHCCGPGGFGKYFPSTPATLKDNNTATRFYLHMVRLYDPSI